MTLQTTTVETTLDNKKHFFDDILQSRTNETKVLSQSINDLLRRDKSVTLHTVRSSRMSMTSGWAFFNILKAFKVNSKEWTVSTPGTSSK